LEEEPFGKEQWQVSECVGTNPSDQPRRKLPVGVTQAVRSSRPAIINTTPKKNKSTVG